LLKHWTRRHTLAAGAILILAVNTIALVGVAYNRSGEPESRLVLSERELRLPPREWGFEHENSGMALHLLWRLPPIKEDLKGRYWDYAASSGTAPWFERAKLAELGFDLSRDPGTEKGKRYYEKVRPRDVLLVLELGGAAHAHILEHARRYAEERDRLAFANPGVKDIAESAKNAREQLRREEKFSSRLFVIDAGVDLAALRAKYPDRARYAIVGGRVRPWVIEENKKARVAGYIETLNISAVNVPLEFRPAFEGATWTHPYAYDEYKGPRFDAAVAFGKRLEPWLTAALRKARD
jgi:hypothetical protein